MLTASAYILLKAYTLSTFLYATFDVRDLASPGSGCSVTVALVVLGGEAESGSVFVVARSSMAVTPRSINCNMAVYRSGGRVGLLGGVYVGGVSVRWVAGAFGFITSVVVGIFLSL